MKAEHAEALGLYAGGAGAEAGLPWRLTGLDPEGMDLIAGERTARVVYPERVTDMGGLRKSLVAMAAQARGGVGTAEA